MIVPAPGTATDTGSLGCGEAEGLGSGEDALGDAVDVGFFDGLLLNVCGFADFVVDVGDGDAEAEAFASFFFVADGEGDAEAAYDGSALGSAGFTAIGVNSGTAVTTTLS